MKNIGFVQIYLIKQESTPPGKRPSTGDSLPWKGPGSRGQEGTCKNITSRRTWYAGGNNSSQKSLVLK